MRALVTGAGGFVGQWLCRALLREGWSVDGVTLEGAPTAGILTARERTSVNWTALDLVPPPSWRSGERWADAADVRVNETDTERTVMSLLAGAPDAVFHLAGIALQSDAAADVERSLSVNVGGAFLLLHAMYRSRRESVCNPTLLVVGSGEQYGKHAPDELPLAETAECRPLTQYGYTKQSQEQMALASAASMKLRVIATRSFNHSGPGQSPKFFLPGLVERVKAAPPHGEIPIGNTDVIRDFLHVEDVVAAYISLVARGTPGEVYNVCSGDGVRIGDLAAEVLAVAGSTATLKVDPALQRAVDVPALVGSNAKLRAATGWAPKKSRKDIISDLLNAAS